MVCRKAYDNTTVIESPYTNGFQLCRYARAAIYITSSLCLYTKISPARHKQ